MVIILRILGVGALVVLVTTLSSYFATASFNLLQFLGLVIWNGGMAFLWFFLAHKLAARRKLRILDALNSPCGQCGSDSSRGYRVCGSCGRVKSPVLL